MFSWLGDILAGLGDSVSAVFESSGAQIAAAIWDGLVEWLYTTIYGAVADLFVSMNHMGAEIFALSWVKAVVELFRLFGWTLYVAGIAMAVFEVAIQYEGGRNSLQGTAISVLKGFLACSLVSVLPVKLYQFAVSLQGIFSHDLVAIFASQQGSLGDAALYVLQNVLGGNLDMSNPLKTLFFLILFSYCCIKIFFDNIKRGGILLIQIAVGELYMVSIPRGFTSGFAAWCKQVIGTCLTAFLQTTMLMLGMLTCEGSLFLGIGIMMAAGEIPKIAQQFGMDASARDTIRGAIHNTSMVVNLARTVAR